MVKELERTWSCLLSTKSSLSLLFLVDPGHLWGEWVGDWKRSVAVEWAEGLAGVGGW